MVSRMAMSRKQFTVTSALGVVFVAEAGFSLSSFGGEGRGEEAFSRLEASVASKVSRTGKSFSGALSKSSICFGVRNFGRRLPIFGNEMFLIGEAPTAPCRIRNL